jgi:hypothetical protein
LTMRLPFGQNRDVRPAGRAELHGERRLENLFEQFALVNRGGRADALGGVETGKPTAERAEKCSGGRARVLSPAAARLILGSIACNVEALRIRLQTTFIRLGCRAL